MERCRVMKAPPAFIERAKKSPKTYAFLNTLNRRNLFSIAFRLHTVKKPETREKPDDKDPGYDGRR
ncbi:MAG TPA: YdeI/OmpD-associated family protein [Saprospiraceae bacterium]|nr:YdeI/OmpD-associated family protein [Saprospiraceae bacterium]HNA76787.1 YdeI/OmpD-associated family protein [Saprospiraceae bacterium]HNF22248.1 YdeI/OmpD-associated family protein [Saprospiraceae bacterium]HNH42093.1 YdeI/OmpD-associated family protein [Saprospiraceae bacterium]HNI92311.1 YdeI/OmpD-associated family protein [Saprospiraceae bacterium]